MKLNRGFQRTENKTVENLYKALSFCFAFVWHMYFQSECDYSGFQMRMSKTQKNREILNKKEASAHTHSQRRKGAHRIQDTEHRN